MALDYDKKRVVKKMIVNPMITKSSGLNSFE